MNFQPCDITVQDDFCNRHLFFISFSILKKKTIRKWKKREEDRDHPFNKTLCLIETEKPLITQMELKKNARKIKYHLWNQPILMLKTFLPLNTKFLSVFVATRNAIAISDHWISLIHFNFFLFFFFVYEERSKHGPKQLPKRSRHAKSLSRFQSMK